jgi:hypothetical protein
MEMLTTAQAAQVAGIDVRNANVMVPRLARALGDLTTNERVVRVRWPAGTVIAIAVLRALDPHGVNPSRWAPGARAVADAHERGLLPAFLVTRGGTDYRVALDADGVERATAGVVAEMSATGGIVRVVRVAPIVEDLCDVLELRALA